MDLFKDSKIFFFWSLSSLLMTCCVTYEIMQYAMQTIRHIPKIYVPKPICMLMQIRCRCILCNIGNRYRYATCLTAYINVVR